jgi:hypothetical protein
MKNTKNQTPNIKQTPSSKQQTALECCDGPLVFEIGKLSGVWCLVFGVSLP